MTSSRPDMPPVPAPHGTTASAPEPVPVPVPVPLPAAHTGRLRLAVGLLIGAGAIYFVVSSAGGFSNSLGALKSARPGWLLAGGLAEAASYAALGLLLRRLVGGRVNRLTGVRLGLLVAGLGNVLPAAPAEGLVMANADCAGGASTPTGPGSPSDSCSGCRSGRSSVSPPLTRWP